MVAVRAKSMVAAMVPVVFDVATNLLAPKVTPIHPDDEGSVLAVQVTPSGDVDATADASAIATKALFP